MGAKLGNGNIESPDRYEPKKAQKDDGRMRSGYVWLSLVHSYIAQCWHEVEWRWKLSTGPGGLYVAG
jgi:hypothetical protein